MAISENEMVLSMFRLFFVAALTGGLLFGIYAYLALDSKQDVLINCLKSHTTVECEKLIHDM